MATVFLAEDSKLGRDVAIKRLHTDAPKASLTRFQREAKLGAALNHPNLVSVYDTLVTDDQEALIVMEYVPGESLADIAARGAVPPERALPILRSLGEALDHVHAQDVVHRDVKPANVLVRDDGFVKLADLGIAKAVGATQLTSEGSVIGTLPYMSPERMRGPGAGGPESDIYALAAVAYEMLSGEPPRETASTEAMTEEEEAHFVDALAAPPGAAAVLQRGLDPNPSKRPVTATRLVEELDSALAGDVDAETVAVPLEADEPEPTEPTARLGAAPRARRPRTSRATGATKVGGAGRRGAAIIAIGAALAAIAGLALALGGGDDGGSDAGGGSAAVPTEQADPKPKEEPAPVAEEAAAPDGVALNDQGFTLLQGGDYEGAIPVLEEAVAALEGSGDDLTYNYALFNLGQALRLGGRPEEAIPVLQERLEYPDQTEEVQAELDAAYEDAGITPDGDGEEGSPGNGKGKAFGGEKGSKGGKHDD